MDKILAATGGGEQTELQRRETVACGREVIGVGRRIGIEGKGATGIGALSLVHLASDDTDASLQAVGTSHELQASRLLPGIVEVDVGLECALVEALNSLSGGQRYSGNARAIGINIDAGDAKLSRLGPSISGLQALERPPAVGGLEYGDSPRIDGIDFV